MSVGFVVDELARGNVLLRVFRFSPVSIIPPMLHKSSIRHRVYQDASLVCQWRRSRRLAWPWSRFKVFSEEERHDV